MPWTGKRRNFESRHCYAIRVIYSGITDKPDAIHMGIEWLPIEHESPLSVPVGRKPT